MSGGALVLAATLAALAGCGPPPASRGEPGGAAAGAHPDTARVTLEGTVAVTAGPAGRDAVTLLPDGGRPVALLGPAADELRAVDGARARVAGRRTEGAAPAGGVEVHSYDLLLVDGARPLVGIVRTAADGPALALPDGSIVLLIGAPPSLSARAGAKAWVVGRREAGGVAVRSYGFLRAL